MFSERLSDAVGFLPRLGGKDDLAKLRVFVPEAGVGAVFPAFKIVPEEKLPHLGGGNVDGFGNVQLGDGKTRHAVEPVQPPGLLAGNQPGLPLLMRLTCFTGVTSTGMFCPEPDSE